MVKIHHPQLHAEATVPESTARALARSGWVPAEDAAEESMPTPPAKSASKNEWVEWHVSQGMQRPEAEAYTRDELADLS